MTARILALCVLLAIAAPATAAEETIAVNSFPSASNLPIWVAQRQGMFERHGVAVHLTHPHGSVEQFKKLMGGEYQVVMTALDNVIAYHDGAGATGSSEPSDILAFMGMDSGFLTLVAAPGTRAVADLKGKVMAVDALTTGFSFALEELLVRGGVAKDAVTYLAVGSSGERWKALEAGKAQAGLLTMPVDVEAKAKGYAALATVAGTLGHYNATVAAARESWAAAHKPAVVGFLRAYREAVAWMVARRHRNQAIAVLAVEMPGLDPKSLGPIYDQLTSRKEGVYRDLSIDAKGAAMVLDLRARYAPKPPAAQDWRHYVDETYLQAAFRR